MPLRLDVYSDSPLCHGYTWTIVDEHRLARLIAWLMLGEHLHAAEVLRALRRDVPRLRRRHLDMRVAQLAATPASDQERWHRDGWIFQMMSWVAAQLTEPRSTLIRAPQPRPADKGLDGIMVSMGAQSYVTIWEDKATENARHTITSKVWPELLAFEEAKRDNEVVTEVSTLLERVDDPNERREAIERALWPSGGWRYRVCITIATDHDGKDGRTALFKGYDKRVAGTECDRRRGETIVLSDLRAWMDSFAALIASELTSLRAVADV